MENMVNENRGNTNEKVYFDLMVELLFVSFSMTAFAKEVDKGEVDFNLYIDYWNTAEKVYEIDGSEFKVLASELIITRGILTAYKIVEMHDDYKDTKLGIVYVWATFISIIN